MAAKLHQGHVTGSRDIQNGRILSGQPLFRVHKRTSLVEVELNICGAALFDQHASLRVGWTQQFREGPVVVTVLV